MGRSIDISGTPSRVFRYLVWCWLPFAVPLLAGAWGTAALRYFGVADVEFFGSQWSLVVLALGTPVLTWLWMHRLQTSDGQWWEPLPTEQYLGRFAAHGGLARHNWERAIRQLPDGDEEDD